MPSNPISRTARGGFVTCTPMFWIAKFLFDAKSPEELVDRGVFTRAELSTFQKSEDFLWAVRCHLHFVSKRGEDKLTFDRQNELAERLGYKAHGG